MTWEKGRDVIEALLERKYLERVTANPADADHLLAKARRHLATAAELADDDPEIAYDALYAAARKALTAVLQQQGLRPTQAGGHEAVIQAAGALSADDVRSDLPFAAAIVDAAARIVPQMSVFIPTR